MSRTWYDEPDLAVSHGNFSVLSGSCLTLWGTGLGPDTAPHRELLLRGNQPLVIGRAEGNRVPYLDPAYRSTTVFPGTGKTILREAGQGRDTFVSRGHFMLRAAPGGILLVNGVPSPGGGIRPPINGTYLLAPEERQLIPGEEYLIEFGCRVDLMLPNNSTVRIEAG